MNKCREMRERKCKPDTMIYSGSATRTIPCPTPLPDSPTREFSSLLNTLPLGGENLTQLLLTPFNDTKLNVKF